MLPKVNYLYVCGILRIARGILKPGRICAKRLSDGHFNFARSQLDTESEIFNSYFDNEEAHQIFTKRGKIYFSVPGLTFMAQVTCDVERNI